MKSIRKTYLHFHTPLKPPSFSYHSSLSLHQFHPSILCELKNDRPAAKIEARGKEMNENKKGAKKKSNTNFSPSDMVNPLWICQHSSNTNFFPARNKLTNFHEYNR
jgi:hypothetical protein